MLAPLQNQTKNNADIGAACAARSIMAALDETFWSKTLKAIMLCYHLADPSPKMAKAEI